MKDIVPYVPPTVRALGIVQLNARTPTLSIGARFFIDGSLRRDALLGAITASARLSDKLLVSFQLQRPRLLGDGIRLDQTTRLDAAVANIL